MVREAGTMALKDARVQYDEVEAVVASYCYGEPTAGFKLLASKLD